MFVSACERVADFEYQSGGGAGTGDYLLVVKPVGWEGINGEKIKWTISPGPSMVENRRMIPTLILTIGI